MDYTDQTEILVSEELECFRDSASAIYQRSLEGNANNFEAATKTALGTLTIQPKKLKHQGRDSNLITNETKPHSTPATLLWLGKNYELAEGICIPRNTLYSHYVHFCKINFMNPLNSASFGKIIRQAFPSLTTRRLGTRGQSRYHYYGIAIKDTSPYYDIAFSKMSSNSSDGKKSSEKNGGSVALNKKKGTLKLWPEFPNIKEISFPPHICQEKVNSFIIMYHTHCQRIFDTIIRGTLDDAYQFFEHFWQGVPSHLCDLLGTNTVINMVGVCDSILYRTICSVLMPSVLKRCSENLIHMIRNFADKLENWINSALSDIPQNLKTIKLELGKRFCTTLKRQMILYQLTHTAHVVLNNCDMMNHIKKDWKRINLELITIQALLFTDLSHDNRETIKYISGYWMNFQELVEKRAAIEDFAEKVENIVHTCVVEISEKKQIPLRKVARTFILLWHVIESLISRDMTIHSAASFGSFHLIQTLFDEYMHYLVEMIQSENITKYLLKNISLDVLPILDNWSEFNERKNCVDILETTSTESVLVNYSGENLEVIQSDLQCNNILNHCETDFDFSKNNSLQTDFNFFNNQCEYQNVRESDMKLNYSNTFSDIVPEFTTCAPDCLEYATGIYCQGIPQHNSHNLQYQNTCANEVNFEV